MQYSDAKDYIKNNLKQYLQIHGINPNKNFACLTNHADKTPSMSYKRMADGKEQVHCFSCKYNADVFELIKLQYGLNTWDEQFSKGCELFNITLDSQKGGKVNLRRTNTTTSEGEGVKMAYSANMDVINKTIQQAIQQVGQTDYLTNRGLSAETIAECKLGFLRDYQYPYIDKETGEPKTWGVGDVIVIPTSDNFLVRPITAKYTGDAKYLKANGMTQRLYSPINTANEDIIFVVEGEIDCLSIIEVGGACIGLGSTSNINLLFDYVRGFGHGKTFIIAMDNDDAGRKATDKITAELSSLLAKFKVINLFDTYNDANEILVKNRELLIENVITAIDTITAENKAEQDEKQRLELVEYQKNNVSNQLQGFINGISDKVDTSAIPTNFPKLDSILDDGLYEGLYCIGAISSLGKTTMILQIADSIAENNTDILIFSLEMARTELMSKTISRLTFEIAGKNFRTHAKTARGITAGKRHKNYSTEEKEIMISAICAYSAYAQNIYIHEGIGDIGVKQIREQVEKHIRLTGNKPVVIIDYLQILAPADVRASDKQNTDSAVLELKRLSRDKKLPVIAITSFNRANYEKEVNMASAKESGAIEYSADVLIGLQLKGIGTNGFDVDKAKSASPREIELKILKNRNGATGGTINYEYYPAYNFFKEV